jgi:hypothetical protein
LRFGPLKAGRGRTYVPAKSKSGDGRGTFRKKLGFAAVLYKECRRHLRRAAVAPKKMGMPNERRGRMNQSLLRIAARVACVALVVSVVFPLGRMLFPYVGAEFGVLQFSALEAVLSTTVGFGIYTAFFG